MRDRGALIVVGGLLFAALGVVAILAQPTIGSDVSSSDSAPAGPSRHMYR